MKRQHEHFPEWKEREKNLFEFRGPPTCNFNCWIINWWNYLVASMCYRPQTVKVIHREVASSDNCEMLDSPFWRRTQEYQAELYRSHPNHHYRRYYHHRIMSAVSRFVSIILHSGLWLFYIHCLQKNQHNQLESQQQDQQESEQQQQKVITKMWIAIAT